MKNLIGLFLILIIFSSCDSRKEASNARDFVNITLNMDTVIVDPGDEILAAGSNMFTADITPDKKYLLNLDQKTHHLEIVDLDKLVLDRKVKFEKEGPNGTGNYVNVLVALPDQKIAFTSFMNSAIFEWEGKKLMEKSVQNIEFKGDPLEEGEGLSPRYLFDNKDNSIFYTFITNFKTQSTQIAKVDLKTDSLKKIDIPELKKLENFRILFEQGNGMSLRDQSIYLQKWGEQVFVSNSGFNEIFIYHPDKDTVTHKSFNSSLTENEIKGSYKNNVSSREEFKNESDNLRKEISFEDFKWDGSTKKFYRLSSFTVPGEGDLPSKSQVFLTVFDDQLNMLAETKVEGYNKIPPKHFAKDGKIYLYENIDDELGFIVLDIKLD